MRSARQIPLHRVLQSSSEWSVDGSHVNIADVHSAASNILARVSLYDRTILSIETFFQFMPAKYIIPRENKIYPADLGRNTDHGIFCRETQHDDSVKLIFGKVFPFLLRLGTYICRYQTQLNSKECYVFVCVTEVPRRLNELWEPCTQLVLCDVLPGAL